MNYMRDEYKDIVIEKIIDIIIYALICVSLFLIGANNNISKDASELLGGVIIVSFGFGISNLVILIAITIHELFY